MDRVPMISQPINTTNVSSSGSVNQVCCIQSYLTPQWCEEVQVLLNQTNEWVPHWYTRQSTSATHSIFTCYGDDKQTRRVAHLDIDITKVAFC
jgi:hypothetical protein